MRAETTSPTTAVAQQAEPVYLRVFTFGPFRIEWIDPATGQATPLPAERLHGRGAAPSLALLKALLGRPDRFATRDWIMDQFWPESKRRSAEERLDDVASSLRTLLRPEGSSAKLVQYVYGSDGRGAGYRLAGYPQIWCDADAFVWYVEHASLLDRMGQDSSACWQRAYELAARGMYLPEHLYEDWARARRETLEGLLRDCVQRWSQLLRQAGHVDEAIRRLRTYWEERPTDEDALRLLLELLGERERFGEAEACYAKAEAALAEDGHEPDPRTREMLEYIKALQIRRSPVRDVRTETPRTLISNSPGLALVETLTQAKEEKQLSHSNSQVSFWQTDVYHPHMVSRLAVWSFLRQEGTLANRHKIVYDKMTDEIIAMMFQHEHSAGRSLLLQQSVYDVIRKYDVTYRGHMNFETQLSRRHALQTIARLPIQLYGLTFMGFGQRKIPAAEEALPLFAAGIAACWCQYTPEEMQVVRSTLSAYLPTLEHFALQSSPSQQTAAHLASQAYLLTCIVAEHDSNLDLMESASGLARFYAQIARDPNLEIAALVRLAVRFGFSERNLKALKVYQEAAALPAFGNVSPLLQGRVYAGLAGKYAACQQTPEALSFLDKAKEIYPSNPQSDPSYSFASCGKYSLTYFEGIVLEQTGQFLEAANIFQQYGSLTPLPGVPEVNRAEHLNHAAQVAMKQRNLDAACLYLDHAEELAWTLQHEGLSSDQREMLKSLQLLWPDEPMVKTLQEKMHARRL